MRVEDRGGVLRPAMWALTEEWYCSNSFSLSQPFDVDYLMLMHFWMARGGAEWAPPEL